jgi:hypothetical protein
MTKHSSLKENNKLNKFCQWASSTIDKNQAASSYQYHSSLSLSLKIARRLESSTLLRIPSGFCDDPLWRKKNKLTMFLQLEDISKEFSLANKFEYCYGSLYEKRINARENSTRILHFC